MFMTMLLMLLLIWIPRFPWNSAPIFSNYEIFKSLPSTEEAVIPYWDYWGDPLCIIISTIICTTMAFPIVWSIYIVNQEKKAKHPDDGTPTGPSAETADAAPNQAVPNECNQPVGESRKKLQAKPNIDREKTKKRRKKNKKRKKKGR